MSSAAKVLALAAVLGGSWVQLRAAAAPPVLFFPNLGSYHRAVTTQSAEAQRYFDQGLNLLFGYKNDWAVRSFLAAARLDPGCALAHWGAALACGPNINDPVMSAEAAALAWKELRLADDAAHASPEERALIGALDRRYAPNSPADRSGLDQAYARALREVWRRYPDDGDVGCLFAEALMDLNPWHQWRRSGAPTRDTPEILATLNAVLARQPDHPFANHLLIHALEASPHPEQALEAADRLRHLEPGLGHNVHMPSHIYIRTGRWQEAVDCSLCAVAADSEFEALAGPPHGIQVVYAAHDEHMLAYAAMMTGQSSLALAHVRALVHSLTPEARRANRDMADGYLAMPLEVLVRFGRWPEVLAEPEPTDPAMAFARAFRHAARGIAQAALGDTAAARREEEAYHNALPLIPAGAWFGANSVSSLTALISRMLSGEIALREGRTLWGLLNLRLAVADEDGLNYAEPPTWLIPVRHSYGAALARAGHYSLAESVYRDDLARLPGDPWALFGLATALRLDGQAQEAALTQRRFDAAWSRADCAIDSSCLCQRMIARRP